MTERPDGEFIGHLCSHCYKPIGKGFGGKISEVAEWLHLDCVPLRFHCEAKDKLCFDKPASDQPCRRCFDEPTIEELADD